MKTRSFGAACVLGVSLGAVMVPAAHAATVATCHGVRATIVSSAATVTGTTGRDIIFGTRRAGQTINSLSGNDTICTSSGPDVINAADGNDMVFAGAGNDKVLGGPGTDTLVGGMGADTMKGGTGNDRIDGGGGNDSIQGNGGNDILMGSSGSDRITGGTQPDIFAGGTGIDRIVAGTPGDTCASDAADPITGVCEIDTTGPEISDVSLPGAVNAGDTITVTWRITDSSGIDSLGAGPDGGFGPNTRAILTGAYGFVYWSGCSLAVTRISGSATDGVYRASCSIPAAAPNATYSFQISAADMLGNGLPGHSRFFEFEVQNGSSDYDSPSVSYGGGLADFYHAGDNVAFTLRGTDDTGVAGICVFVLGPNGRVVDDNALGWIDASDTSLTSGTAQDGLYTVKIKLAATAIPGEYRFLLGYSDTIGNRAWNEASYAGYPGIRVIP